MPAPAQPTTTAPAGLGAAGKALWEDVSDGLTFRADELALLGAAARTADQIAALEESIGEETMIDGSRGQRVLHPAIAEARQQRQLLGSLLAKLDIPEREGIGSEWDNLSASQRARKAAGARWHRGAA